MSKRILKRPEVEYKTSLSRSHLYQLIQNGEFPQQIKLTEHGRSVGWLESDVDDWLEERIAKTKEAA